MNGSGDGTQNTASGTMNGHGDGAQNTVPKNLNRSDDLRFKAASDGRRRDRTAILLFWARAARPADQ